MGIGSPWVQVLAAPYLVALYSPATIPPVAILSSIAAFILYRARRKAKRHRVPLAVLGSFCLYVFLAQFTAFLVDRADREFQSWYENKAGITIGMDYGTALRAASRHAFLEDPPYFNDTRSEYSIHDFILVPKGLAVLNLKNHLEGRQYPTLSMVLDRNDKVIEVNCIDLGPHARSILQQ